jgi:hypothetical protein
MKAPGNVNFSVTEYEKSASVSAPGIEPQTIALLTDRGNSSRETSLVAGPT